MSSFMIDLIAFDFSVLLLFVSASWLMCFVANDDLRFTVLVYVCIYSLLRTEDNIQTPYDMCTDLLHDLIKTRKNHSPTRK